MPDSDHPAFPDRGSDPKEWLRRGLTPPSVIAEWVKDRTADPQPLHEPTYADFLEDPNR